MSKLVKAVASWLLSAIGAEKFVKSTVRGKEVVEASGKDTRVVVSGDAYMVYSKHYTNVYGRITRGVKKSQVISVVNRVGNIEGPARVVKKIMRAHKLMPHGKWFVTPSSIITIVKTQKGEYGKLVVYDAITNKRPELRKLKEGYEVGNPEIPQKVQKKEVKNDFDFKRFSAYISLVESLRPTYKGLRDYLRSAHKAGMINYERLDLDNKEDTLDLLIKAARKMSLEEKKDRKYPEVIVDRRKAISKVIKKKGAAKAASKSSTKSKGERKWKEYL